MSIFIRNPVYWGKVQVYVTYKQSDIVRKTWTSILGHKFGEIFHPAESKADVFHIIIWVEPPTEGSHQSRKDKKWMEISIKEWPEMIHPFI